MGTATPTTICPVPANTVSLNEVTDVQGQCLSEVAVQVLFPVERERTLLNSERDRGSVTRITNSLHDLFKDIEEHW